MNDWFVIVIIAVIAAGLSVAVWFIRIKRDERKQRERMHRRRVEDAEREEMFAENARAWQRGEPPTDDDSTKTLPILPGQEP